MDDAFTSHKLNAKGLSAAEAIAEEFDSFLGYATSFGGDNRCKAIVRTKLEEACFYAKKAMATNTTYQETN